MSLVLTFENSESASCTVSSRICQFEEKINVPGRSVHELDLGTCEVLKFDFPSPD